MRELFTRPVRAARRAAPATEYTLVLGGGAHLGAIQAGQLLALAEHGISVGRIVGCSIGSLNGAFISRGLNVELARELVELWKQASTEELFDRGLHRIVSVIRQRQSISRPDRIAEMIARACPDEELSAFPTPTEVVTCNLTRGAAQYHRSGRARQVIQASCAMPGLLPPVKLDGETHVDGGVLDVLPWRHALHTAAADEQIIVLDCHGGRSWQEPHGENALSVLLASFALARHHRSYEGIDGLDRIHVLPAPAATIRGLDPAGVEDLITRAHQQTHEWLAGGGLHTSGTPTRRFSRFRTGLTPR
jgi:NTE family protein